MHFFYHPPEPNTSLFPFSSCRSPFAFTLKAGPADKNKDEG
jgi:hypothetical protein